MSKIKKIVAYLLTLAMLISVFNFSSFASKADETVDENTLITSEVSSDEIDETSENTTGEITEEPENIPEYLSETSTEDVTEEVLDNTEEVTEITTEEEVTEDESPYLYLKMSEGGSIRFNNATYSVDDDILYKDLVEYARPNNLGYFKIDEDLTSVSVIALAELNGTISDFKVSSYDGSNFTLLYQGNSGIDCQMKKTIKRLNEEKDSQSGLVAKFYALCRGFGEEYIESQAMGILEREAMERQQKKLTHKRHDRDAR